MLNSTSTSLNSAKLSEYYGRLRQPTTQARSTKEISFQHHFRYAIMIQQYFNHGKSGD